MCLYIYIISYALYIHVYIYTLMYMYIYIHILFVQAQADPHSSTEALVTAVPELGRRGTPAAFALSLGLRSWPQFGCFHSLGLLFKGFRGLL